jgi:hypothetical protein
VRATAERIRPTSEGPIRSTASRRRPAKPRLGEMLLSTIRPEVSFYTPCGARPAGAKPCKTVGTLRECPCHLARDWPPIPGARFGVAALTSAPTAEGLHSRSGQPTRNPLTGSGPAVACACGRYPRVSPIDNRIENGSVAEALIASTLRSKDLRQKVDERKHGTALPVQRRLQPVRTG